MTKLSAIQQIILAKMQPGIWYPGGELPGTGHSLIALEKKGLIKSEPTEAGKHLERSGVYTPIRWTRRFMKLDR